MALAVALGLSACDQDERSAFTKWLDGGWTAGSFVQSGTRVAQSTPTDADLLALWRSAEASVDDESVSVVTPEAARALLEDCPNRELVIGEVTAGAIPDAWALCSREISSTCTTFVVVGLERTADGAWIVACAFMAGIS